MLITNVDIIRADGSAKRYVCCCKGGRFAYIGKDIPPGEWKVIDGGNILIPGLVNSTPMFR